MMSVEHPRQRGIEIGVRTYLVERATTAPALRA